MASGKIAQIGRDERHPDRNEAVSQIDALGHEVNGKPVSDEKPYRIRKRACGDCAPGLRELQEVAHTELGSVVSSFVVAPILGDQIALGISYKGMRVGRMISLAPQNDPKKTEQPRNGHGRPPSPTKVNGEHDEWRDRAAHGRTAVKKGGGEAALVFGKPFRDGFGRRRPVRRFRRAEKEAKKSEAVKAASQR